MEKWRKECREEWAEMQKWQLIILQRFDFEIPFLSLSGMTLRDLEEIYDELEENEKMREKG